MKIICAICRQCGAEFHAHLYPSRSIVPATCSRRCHNRRNAEAARGRHAHVLPSSIPSPDHSGLTALLPLSNATVMAIVDAADLEWLMRFTWHLTTDGYVATNMWDGTRYKCVLLHRLLLALIGQPQVLGDHKNRQPLDNRRDNLRAATHAINAQNQSGWAVSEAGLRGVNRVGSGRWQARAQIDRRSHLLGVFDTKEQAASAASVFRASRMPGAIEATE